jgi:hypothetical protein
VAKSRKWMAKAFAGSHGQFKAKAERAGKSTAAFASAHEHSKGKLGKQARLAQAGMHANHSEKRRSVMYD